MGKCVKIGFPKFYQLQDIGNKDIVLIDGILANDSDLLLLEKAIENSRKYKIEHRITDLDISNAVQDSKIK